MVRQRNSIRTTEPTRYEVVLVLPGDQAEIVGYTARVGGPGLAPYFSSNIERIRANVPDGSFIHKSGGGLRAMIEIGACAVKFTGRTEREAASSESVR